MQKKSKLNVFTFMMLIIIGLTFQPAISTYAVCPDDMTTYFKLDETTAGPYTDFINGKVGTGRTTTPPTPAAGTVNGAQLFDGGSTTGINVPADRSFNWLGNESFSIEFLVKTDGDVDPDENWVIIGRDDADTSLHWWVGIHETDGLASFFLKATNGDGPASLLGVGSIKLSDGNWHHVVAVRDAINEVNIIYVDGFEQGRTAAHTYTAGFGSNAADLNMGWLNLSSGFYFDGLIDEVALYDRALDEQEIIDHSAAALAVPGEDYCAGSAAPEPESDAPFPDDTISLWKLDETVGSEYADAFGDNLGTGKATTPPTPAAGTVDGAQLFDGGSTTGINVPADRSFNWQGNESFSIEFLVKTDGDVDPDENWVIIGRDDADTDLIWWVGLNETSGLPHFNLKDTNGNGPASLSGVGSIKLSDGNWHHVVAVRDAINEINIIYVDGSEQGSTAAHTYTAGFGSNAADLNIGWLNLSSGFYFDGLIDEVALYDRALEEGEIQDHSDAALAVPGEGIESLRPAPEANAGPDQPNVKETTVVTLVGTGSSPGYAAAPITTYSWIETTGSGVTINNANTATATFTAPDVAAAGETLTFELTVTADDGQSSSDNVDVDVVDRILPVADAGTDQSVTEGDPVTLDGSGSSDDGTIVSYLWEEVTTTGVTINNDTTTPTATFTAPDVAAAGEILTFKLTVTDEDGLKDSDTTIVTVNDNPIPPVADAGDDKNVTEGDPVTLNGTGSTGTGLTFAWSPSTGSGWALSDATAESPTFTAPDVDAAGAILTFQLTVTDNLGATSSDDVNVNVADASSPLQAVAGDDQTVTVGDTVTLDSTGSTGPIASYAWEQVIIADESRVQLSNADTPTATFIAPDASASDDVAAALLETLTFQLTVTDNTGAESSDTVEVNIDDGTSTRSGGGGGGGGCFINSMF